ncbi:MAG: hypothetical protein ISR59_03855 [Anaerolineales bacterium]|uniref:Uncharacterized protein n=1 Tax=Candidatus Desulfolinea nitratireducens TaxID=2841698 RepID=A0A8J6TEI1_9CHLR|nr:hypothetical protein [Candidatus Desulfolinea nitratireducens]MBL6960219.1 hypothetical protein [Anaerolineales bacterium]
MRKIILLRSAFSQAWGVMFRRRLGEKIFVFIYPTKTRRLFQTFFCPSLRIVALARGDEQDVEIVFKKVISSWCFVSLPPADLIVEMAPDMQMDEKLIADIISAVGEHKNSAVGGIDANTGIKDLIFALFAASVADLRRVRSVCGISGYGRVDPEIIRNHFSPWERGKILASAGFILDCRIEAQISIPDGAVSLSRQMFDVENAFQDELFAAALAGVPWEKEFSKACIRCGKNASWRFVLPSENLSPELAWRLKRPENAVPLCRDCTRKLHFAKNEQVRRQLLWGLWGPRFEALESWFLAVRGEGVYRLPHNWDKAEHPLWPEEFGGKNWASGSGNVMNCVPREPKEIRRTQAQKRVLAELLGSTPRLP